MAALILRLDFFGLDFADSLTASQLWPTSRYIVIEFVLSFSSESEYQGCLLFTEISRFAFAARSFTINFDREVRVNSM
jgi:hypothetical protein